MSSASHHGTSRLSTDDAAAQEDPTYPSSSLPPLAEGRQTTAVKQIMAQCVATTSSTKYAQWNSGFALFCFDSTELRNNLLEPWFVEGMRKIKKLNDRKKYAKVCCLSSSLEDDNCPFILSNLTFAQFSGGDLMEGWSGGSQ